MWNGQILPALWISQTEIIPHNGVSTTPMVRKFKRCVDKHSYASLEPIPRFDLTHDESRRDGRPRPAEGWRRSTNSRPTKWTSEHERESEFNSIFSEYPHQTQIQIWHQSDWPSHVMRIECQSIDCSSDFRATRRLFSITCADEEAPFQLVLSHLDIAKWSFTNAHHFAFWIE